MAQQSVHIGQQLGHYRLLRLLGSGGFADVYLGEHVHLQTQAAIKVLHTHLTGADIEAFRGEARTVAFLQHPSIVRVLDFGVEQTTPYLVMDYAPNGSLRGRYLRGSVLPVSVVVPLLMQVASALHYAHGQRLIHRDVKPENMLLGRQFEVLLSDFGIALVTQSSHSQSAQNIAGTIAYMAPEQIQAHPRPASDQYALGIVIYEWLCGSPPFQGSYMEIAVKHALTAPTPLRQRIPSLPAPVEQVVLRALHKDPQQRFENVLAFAQAFAQAAHYAPSQPAMGPVASPPSWSGPAQPMHPAYTSSNGPTFISAPNAQVGVSTQGGRDVVTPPIFGNVPPPFTNPPYTVTTGTPYPLPSSPVPSSSPYSTFLPPGTYQPAGPGYPSQPVARAGGVSRRAVIIGGLAGLAAAGGAGAWLYAHLAPGGRSASNPPGIPTSAPTSTSTSTTSTVSINGTPVGGNKLDTPLLTYTGHHGIVFAISWSPDGAWIASGSQDGECQVWTADAGKLIFSIHSTIQPPISDDFVQSLVWSRHTPPRLAIGFIDGTLQVLDINQRARLGALTQGYTTDGVLSWSPDEKYLAVCKNLTDPGVLVYDVATWNVVTTYKEHTDSVHVVEWSPDGTSIASGSADTTIRIWDPLSGQTRLVYKGHTDDIAALHWSSDSTKIVSTAQDYVVRIWQVDTGNTLATHQYPSRAPMGKVIWSHNNKFVAAYPGVGTVDILDAQLAVKRTIQTGVTYDITWSPDDTRIATANYDNVAQVWSVGL